MIRMLAAVSFLALLGSAPSAAGDGPVFDAEGRMAYPADYRDWVFVTSGHGMSYNPQANAAADAPFDNVFVNRSAHAEFLKTGHWPDGTVLVLEIRGATSHGSINKAGAFQQGAPVGVEVHVRDSKRFGGSQDGWAFFGFDPAAPEPATKVPETAACYTCHRDNAAVDRTFVQFYPTLLPVATAKGTLSQSYLRNEAASRQPEPARPPGG